MQISSRFTEYGLTGGFFWISQFILLWYYGKIQVLQSYLSAIQIPPGISQIGFTAITGLVSALGIIAVFVAGLLLDLFAVYFKPMEMRIFQQHLARNRDWLGRLIADHKSYCGADYEEFEREGGHFSFKVFRQWRPNILRWWKPYERLWSFLASYVVVESGSSQLGLMLDQYYLWRTGRAISAVLFIVSLEIFASLHILLFRSSLTELPFSVFLPIVSLISTFLMITITQETYSRLCFTLFSLVYVTQDKRNEEVKNLA